MSKVRLRPRQHLAIFGAILALAIAMTVVLVWGQEAFPSIFLLLGRLHPIILHLPIGILLLIAIFELILPRWMASRETQEQTLVMLILGSAGAVFAALTGLLLSEEGGYEGNLISWHKWAGILVAIGSVLAIFLKVWSIGRFKSKVNVAYRLTLTVTIGLVLAAGHYGGQLTHGQDYLTEHLPGFLKRWVGFTTADSPEDSVNIMQASLFEQMIRPVLATHCAECHGEGKQRGDLRLDTLEAILKGGESGPVLRAGDPNGSEIYRRLILPVEDEERMPPGARTPVPIIDTEILRWWIEQGADPEMTLAEGGNPPAAVRAYLNRLGAGSGKQENPILALQLPPPDPGAVQALQELGVMVTPLVQDKNHLSVQANYAGGQFGDEQLQLLRPLASQIVTLNLAGTGVSDNGLEILSELTNLVRLHLERTSISGDGLKILAELPALEYLNLYGTKVDDDVVTHIEKAPGLRSVYLWETGMTAEAIERLVDARPRLQVNVGVFGVSNGASSPQDSADTNDFTATVPDS